MKAKSFMLMFASILTLVLFIGLASAVTLAEWPLTASGTAINVDDDVTVSVFTSSGVTFNDFDPTDGAGAEDWSTGAINTSKYYQVTISPNTGYAIDLSDISFNYNTSDPATLASFQLQYSKSSGFSSPTTIDTKTDVTTTEVNYSKTLDIQVKSGETLYIRWFGYGFDDATEEFYIKNLKVGGEVIDTFCDLGAINYSDLTLSVDIKNTGQGEEDEWLPLDTIEIEVELENDKDSNGDDLYDLDNVIFEIGLFEESSNKNIIDDMIWISEDDEEFEFGDINEDEKGSHTFEFRINPAEIDPDVKDYILMVKAYPRGSEDEYCVDYSGDLGDFGNSEYYADITIKTESDKDKMVILDEESFTIIEVGCGQQVTFDTDVYNIGDQDFEDQFMVNLYNTELGIDLKEVVVENLDAGETAEVSFTFIIPLTAEEKQYTLSMRTYYDYDEGDGKYETDYDRRSDDTFTAYLKVEGNCIINKTATVSATLESGGKAGQELVVKATITNTGDESVTYDVNIAGYSEWASTATTDVSTFTLAEGASQDVTVTLDVKKDASGTKLFDIEVLSDNQLIKKQQVSVSIEKAGISFPGISSDVFLEENLYLWGIAGGVVILVIVISIVLVRRAKKGRAP